MSCILLISEMPEVCKTIPNMKGNAMNKLDSSKSWGGAEQSALGTNFSRLGHKLLQGLFLLYSLIVLFKLIFQRVIILTRIMSMLLPSTMRTITAISFI
jgi:hypothetical protein